MATRKSVINTCLVFFLDTVLRILYVVLLFAIEYCIFGNFRVFCDFGTSREF